MTLAPVRTVAPAADLVSLAEAKAQCRVEDSDSDVLITALIKAATDHLDGFSGVLGRALITQTWAVDFGGFSDLMRLPVGNLLAVSSITYYDSANVQQTLASSVWTTFTDARGPYVMLKPGESWPAAYDRPDAVRVTWTAGYGATSASVPAAIKQAALLLVGHWYDNRAAVNVGSSVAEVPFAVDALIAPFIRNRI